jgi:hypothetical protein
MNRACSTNGDNMNTYRILMERTERKIPLGIPRRRWMNNIKMDLTVIAWGVTDWADQVEVGDQWRALVNTVMNLHVA